MSIKTIIKKHLFVTSLGVLLLGGGLAAIGNSVVTTSNSQATGSIQAKISKNRVKEIIADYTGIADLSYKKLELDYDNNYSNPHYEVDTYKDGVEYDFDIDAVTGQVLSYSTDSKGGKTTSSSSTASDSNQNQNDIISQDKVKEIVAKETGKDDLTYAYIKLEMDDGRQIYDVKATSDDSKYDLDIDAQTGQVLSSEQEKISKNNASTSKNNSPQLSEEQIKDIVRQTTGQGNLTYTEIELSQDEDYGGKLIYEVTAYSSGVEYELDIDANSGQVLSSSAERDDD